MKYFIFWMILWLTSILQVILGYVLYHLDWSLVFWVRIRICILQYCCILLDSMFHLIFYFLYYHFIVHCEFYLWMHLSILLSNNDFCYVQSISFWLSIGLSMCLLYFYYYLSNVVVLMIYLSLFLYFKLSIEINDFFSDFS